MARPTKRVCGAIATTITTRSGRVAGRVALEEESDEDAADDDDSASSSSSASSDDTRWRPRRFTANFGEFDEEKRKIL